MDVVTADLCSTCRLIHDAVVARHIADTERLAHLDDLQRRRMELLEREHAQMAARIREYEARDRRTTA